MSDLFSSIPPSHAPLAARMRPKCMAHYFGQTHLTAHDAPLGQAIAQQQIHSMLLWGPPGTGKTTLAEIIAHEANAQFIRLSAVTSGVKDIRDAMERAQMSSPTIVFVDEVHRFNKAQQDAFLPHIESGLITFIGATTENPAFSCNNALLSRCRVYILNALAPAEIAQIVEHAISHDPELLAQGVSISDEALHGLCKMVGGDARKALLFVELAAGLAKGSCINISEIVQAAGAKVGQFDQQGDHFYDVLSAFHKSVRGSSVDGALYWFARFLVSSNDVTPIMRRLLAIASEDIGLADPKALSLCLDAWDTFHRVGPAEGERAIAQACVYCALAPKSNALYAAFKQAKKLATETSDAPVPNHLRNAPTAIAQKQGHGVGYRYSHNEPHAVSAGQTYLPEQLPTPDFYMPSERGLEKKLKQKISFLDELNQHNADDGSADRQA